MAQFIENGVDIVLNGGSNIMNSATIPVKWHFHQDVIKQNPQFVLLIEQNANEINNHQANNLGRRYLCKITEMVKFIQLYQARHHRLAILVLSNTLNRS